MVNMPMIQVNGMMISNQEGSSGMLQHMIQAQQNMT